MKRLYIGTVPTYTVVTHSIGRENGKMLFIGTVPPCSSYRLFWNRKWEEVIHRNGTYIYSSYTQYWNRNGKRLFIGTKSSVTLNLNAKTETMGVDTI